MKKEPDRQDRLPPGGPKWLTAAEVAAELRLNIVTIYRMVDAGKLPGVRIGRNVRIRRDRLDAFLEGKQQEERPHGR